jgi:hypothetical protein
MKREYKSVTEGILVHSVVLQRFRLFQSGFSTEYYQILPFSISSTLPFP